MVARGSVAPSAPPVICFGRTKPLAVTEGPRRVPSTRPSPPVDAEWAAALEQTATAYDRLVGVISVARTPELLESTITMAQLKVLMLLSVVGEQRMSDLAGQLGVSLSTVSGLVDRLVDAGLVQRREAAADRRQVLVSVTAEGSRFMDRFQELGAGHLRQLLAQLDTESLAIVRRAIEVLLEAAAASQSAPVSEVPS